MAQAEIKIVDLEQFKTRFDAIQTKFSEIDRLGILSAKAGKAAPVPGTGWTDRGFDSPEEEVYEDAYDALREEIHLFFNDALSAFRALLAAFENWSAEVEEKSISIDHLVAPMIDFIDKKITDGEVSSVQEIIELFEGGELSGLITDDDKIDESAVAAFEKKHAKSGKTAKQFEDEEDIF